jgi:hypothetical protein
MAMSDARTRQQKYRLRRQRRRVLVSVEVGVAEMEALRRLELLPGGQPDKAMLVEAIQRFLACAPAVAAIPDRLYPR